MADTLRTPLLDLGPDPRSTWLYNHIFGPKEEPKLKTTSPLYEELRKQRRSNAARSGSSSAAKRANLSRAAQAKQAAERASEKGIGYPRRAADGTPRPFNPWAKNSKPDLSEMFSEPDYSKVPSTRVNPNWSYGEPPPPGGGKPSVNWEDALKPPGKLETILKRIKNFRPNPLGLGLGFLTNSTPAGDPEGDANPGIPTWEKEAEEALKEKAARHAKNLEKARQVQGAPPPLDSQEQINELIREKIESHKRDKSDETGADTETQTKGQVDQPPPPTDKTDPSGGSKGNPNIVTAGPPGPTPPGGTVAPPPVPSGNRMELPDKTVNWNPVNNSYVGDNPPARYQRELRNIYDLNTEHWSRLADRYNNRLYRMPVFKANQLGRFNPEALTTEDIMSSIVQAPKIETEDQRQQALNREYFNTDRATGMRAREKQFGLEADIWNDLEKVVKGVYTNQEREKLRTRFDNMLKTFEEVEQLAGDDDQKRLMLYMQLGVNIPSFLAQLSFALRGPLSTLLSTATPHLNKLAQSAGELVPENALAVLGVTGAALAIKELLTLVITALSKGAV